MFESGEWGILVGVVMGSGCFAFCRRLAAEHVKKDREPELRALADGVRVGEADVFCDRPDFEQKRVRETD